MTKFDRNQSTSDIGSDVLTHCAITNTLCNGICAKLHRTWNDNGSIKNCTALMRSDQIGRKNIKRKKKKILRKTKDSDDKDQESSRFVKREKRWEHA